MLTGVHMRSSLKRNPKPKGVRAALAAVPADVRHAALTVHAAPQAQGIPHLLVGGLGVGARGYPRATKDADFLVADEAFRVTPSGLVAGMQDGIPFPSVKRVAVDYLSPRTAGEACALEQARGATSLRAAPVEVLVGMKLAAGRARDDGDIVEMLKAGANRKRIRAYLSAHAPATLAAFNCLAERADREAP